MKLTVSLLFIFSFIHSFTQSEKEEIECLKARNAAYVSADSGKYVLKTFGILAYDEMHEWDFQSYYEEFLINKYSIEYYNAGCGITIYDKCYSDEMRQIIKKQFGDNIFKRTEKEARKIWLDSLKSDSIYEYEIEIDQELALSDYDNYVYNHNVLDTVIIQKEIYREIFNGLNGKVTSENKKIALEYKIDKTGKVLEVNLPKKEDGKYQTLFNDTFEGKNIGIIGYYKDKPKIIKFVTVLKIE